MLLQDLLFGGTQRHALELAKGLDKSRFEVAIWTLAGGDDFRDKARDYGLAVTDLGASIPVGPSAVFRLWRALAARTPDILLPLTVVPNIWGRLFGRARRVPLIIANCRGLADLPRQREAILRNWADHHLCNAEAIRTALIERYKLPPDRASVIPNGVDAAFFRPNRRQPAGKTILCPARLAPVKDIPTLLQAMALLPERHADARLVVLGDGESLPELRAKAAALGLAERVRFAPGTNDPRPFYHQADLVCLSSLKEGLPNVILEAMACGLPAVCTAAGGLPELVVEGETGFLSPPGHAASLAANLDRVLSDPGLGERLGQAGRARVEQGYSLSAMTARHEAVMERLWREKGETRRRKAPSRG